MEFQNVFKVKISEDGKVVFLSVKDSEVRVTTYAIPRPVFEKLLADYQAASN